MMIRPPLSPGVINPAGTESPCSHPARNNVQRLGRTRGVDFARTDKEPKSYWNSTTCGAPRIVGRVALRACDYSIGQFWVVSPETCLIWRSFVSQSQF